MLVFCRCLWRPLTLPAALQGACLRLQAARFWVQSQSCCLQGLPPPQQAAFMSTLAAQHDCQKVISTLRDRRQQLASYSALRSDKLLLRVASRSMAEAMVEAPCCCASLWALSFAAAASFLAAATWLAASCFAACISSSICSICINQTQMTHKARWA